MKIKFNKKRWSLVCFSFIVALIYSIGIYSCGSSSQPTNDFVLYDDLPKNYTVQEYEDSINKYQKKISKMKNDQLITEIDKISQSLGVLNSTVYNGLRPFISDKILEELKSQRGLYIKSFTFDRQQFENTYNFFKNQTSEYFYPTIQTIDREVKKISFFSKREKVLNFERTIESMKLFAAVKTEYPIHKLLILDSVFLDNSNFARMTPAEQAIVGNLTIELQYWIMTTFGREYTDGYWSWREIFEEFPNQVFFEKSLKVFIEKNNELKKQWMITNEEFDKKIKNENHDTIFYRDRLFDKNNFFVLFLLATSDPTIKVIK